MNRGLYFGVEALSAAERRLESITTNLANLSVTGYKRRNTVTASFETALRGARERHLTTKRSIDFSQGTLVATGETYDLALKGQGFFAVETPQGEALTRNGKFHIDHTGTLVCADNFPVAWDGPRGTIDTEGPEIQVDLEGQVWQGSSLLGRLRLANYTDASRLEADALGYLHVPQGLQPTASEARVHQGQLEGSNVSAVDEMVAMISTQRSFESAVRLMSAIEEGYKRLTAR